MDVDAFRAVALLGILLVNLASIASGYPLHLVAGSGHDSWLNRTAVRLVEATLTMKANLLFSFLFGYSFTAADPLRGAPWGSIRPAVPPPSRRPVRDRNAARRPAVRGRRPDHTRGFRPDPLHDAAGQHPRHPGHCAALLGTVAFAVALTASTGSAMLTSLAVQRPFAFPTFLVGLAAGRRHTLADVIRHDRVLRYIQWIGHPVRLAGGVVFAASGGTKNLAGQLVSIVTSPLFAAAYAAAGLRYFQTRPDRRMAPALPPAGRMFLSNYLG